MSASLDGSSLGLSKSAAFSLHLALSLIIFSSLVAMMLLFWFPGKLFFIDGGWQGLKLVAMVDLILGPALTLILYKPGKPKLIFDMSLIAAIQIAALAYGFYTTHQQRTIALVFSEKEFYTVSARDHLDANEQLKRLALTPTSIPNAKWLSVPYYLTPTPTAEEFGQRMQDLLNGYPGPQQRSDQYITLAEGHDDMQRYRLTDSQVNALNAVDAISDSLKKHELNREDVELYTFKARYAEGVAVFDPIELRIVDYIPLEHGVESLSKADLVAANELQ